MSPRTSKEELYRQAVDRHGAELARFLCGYERNAARRQELTQELHLAIWQGLARFRGECSLRTWVYRVAHNVGTSHVRRSVRDGSWLSLDDVDDVADERLAMELTERQLDLARVMALLHRLDPLDRELMLLYLEGLDAASIGELTGLSQRNVATKVHRVKALLARRLDPRRSPP